MLNRLSLIAAIKGGNAGPAAPTYPSADASGASSGNSGGAPDGTIPSRPVQPGQQARLRPDTVSTIPSDGSASPIDLYKREEYGKGQYRVGEKEWSDHIDLLKRMGYSDKETAILGSLYSSEGGQKSDGMTVSGIRPGTQKDLRENDKIARRLDAIGVKKGMLPAEMTPEQRVQVTELYLTDAVSLSKSKLDKSDEITGLQALHLIGDIDTEKAVADSLFRHGAGFGWRAIQKAINRMAGEGAALARTGVKYPLELDGAVGTDTLDSLTAIARDPQMRKRFGDLLAEERINALKEAERRGEEIRWPGEKVRIEHYRALLGSTPRVLMSR